MSGTSNNNKALDARYLSKLIFAQPLDLLLVPQNSTKLDQPGQPTGILMVQDQLFGPSFMLLSNSESTPLNLGSLAASLNQCSFFQS
jgi:hypothetical protein